MAQSESVFEAMKVHLKRNGHAEIHHHPIIENDDLFKIAQFSPTNPNELQLKVWFTVHFHFALRGRENLHSMKKDDLIFLIENGVDVIRLKDKVTKNHRNDSSSSTGAVIYATNDDNCPLGLVKKYLGLLNPGIDSLWQRPLIRKNFESTPSYSMQKVGENTVNRFMKTLSQLLQLSKTYTNHSVRSTSITILGRCFQDNDIAHFSGHRSLGSLGIYKRVSNDRQKEMSHHLHQQIKAPCNKYTVPISFDNTLTDNFTLNCDLLSVNENISQPDVDLDASPKKDFPTTSNSTLGKTNDLLSLDDHNSRPDVNFCSKDANDSSRANISTIDKTGIQVVRHSNREHEVCASENNFNSISGICAQNDSRMFSSFAPILNNCSNVNFTFNFNK